MQHLRNFFKKNFRAADVNGFALVVALLANMVLLAFCVLSVWIATKDIRISSRMVGEKMALDAAEAGLHTLISNFNPENVTASIADNAQIDAENPHSRFSATAPARPTTGPVMVPLPGYSIGGGQQWGQTRYNTTVTGTNDLYKTKVELEVGIGYGPIEMTSMYR